MHFGLASTSRPGAARRARVGLALTAAAATLLVSPPPGGAAGVDGPGTYYMFRSFDSGRPPTDEQDRACDAAFGPRAPSAVIRLNAALFSFSSDPRSGQIVDQTAGYLGPGFFCSGPTVGLEPFDGHFHSAPPVAGLGAASGRGTLTTTPGQPGALLVALRLGIHADPANGVAGGFATSNSVLNPQNAVPNSPTGAVWTSYVVSPPGGKTPPPPPGGAAPQVAAPNPELGFHVVRTLGQTVANGSPDCPEDPLAPVTGVRQASVAPVEPSARDGRLDPSAGGPPAGRMTLCFTGRGPNRGAAGRIELRRGGRQISLMTSGACHDFPTPAGSDLRQQACSMTVRSSSSSGVRGGLVTSNGLVRADAPLEPANSHVWTVALFGPPDPPPAEGSPAPRRAAAPRVTIRRSLRVDRRGSFTIGYACRPGGEDCEVDARAAVRGRRVASRRATVPAGVSTSLRLTATRHLRRLLDERRRLRATVRVASRLGAEVHRVKSRRVVLRRGSR